MLLENKACAGTDYFRTIRLLRWATIPSSIAAICLLLGRQGRAMAKMPAIGPIGAEREDNGSTTNGAYSR